MFISASFNNNSVGISFDKELKKKKILVNNKSILKKNLTKYSSKIIIFSPITMNLFYFSPSLRRKFLDEIIEKSFPEHKENLKKYENILKNRNKLLKKIKENNYVQDRENLDFWTKKLIDSAIIIYKYRRNLIDFIEKNIYRFDKYFDNKNVKIEFFYDSKINFSHFTENNKENFEKKLISEFEKHFKKNLELEIILARTTI
jgi:DNA replication and repair protein RecF